MDVLLAAHPHSHKEPSHDKPSPTHDRRHAGAESRPEYPVKLPSAGLAVCPILQTVTGAVGARGNPSIPSLSDQRAEAGTRLCSHHCRRPEIPVQGLTQKGVAV